MVVVGGDQVQCVIGDFELYIGQYWGYVIVGGGEVYLGDCGVEVVGGNDVGGVGDFGD